MTENRVSVCHVVNAVSTTSVPADIAVSLEKHTDVEADILAWFGTEEFDEMDLVEVHDLNAPATIFGADGQTLRRAHRILAEYDIVQTHHNHSGTFAKLIAYVQGTPIISTEQNNHDGFSRKGLIFNALTNVLADEVTCVSSTVRDSFRSWEGLLLDDAHLHVIHNGVNLERVGEGVRSDWSVRDVTDISQDSVLIANAGRLAYQKGLDTLIEAVTVARDDVEMEVAIAGEGPLRDELERYAEELNVSNSVHLLGKIDRRHAYKLMAEANIYAMPSRWEGFSAAAVEALSVGTPCVFSDIDEFLRPFSEAARFHEVNDAKSLAQELTELAGNESLRSDLRERGQAKAKEYSLESISKEYEKLYHSLL